MEVSAWGMPDSLLGMLQRGRGRGYTRALVTRGADAVVLECIAHDPRWDRQTEERESYDARLVLDLGIPVSEIPLDPDDADVTAGLAFGVLVELAGRGSAAAATVLRANLDRIDDETLRTVVRAGDDGPWQAYADDPRVADALAASRPTAARPSVPDVGGCPTAELRALADSPRPLTRLAALRELSRRGDLALLDLAERADLRGAACAVPGLRVPVVGLGVAALPRARVWLDGESPWLRDLGRAVVCAHGGPEAAPRLLTWFDQAVADSAWCDTEQLADGLARLGHRPATPSILRAWAVTEHSFARRHYLPALVLLDAPGLARVLAEAVDDCESAVRDVARCARHGGRSGHTDPSATTPASPPS